MCTGGFAILSGDAPSRSRGRMSPKVSATVAVVLGLAAVAAIPAGIAVAQESASIDLLKSLYGSVPAAAVLGLIAALFGRRARLGVARSVHREGVGLTRLGRLLAWTGLYFALIGAISLGVDAILRARN
jgi:hypothetical protein